MYTAVISPTRLGSIRRRMVSPSSAPLVRAS